MLRTQYTAVMRILQYVPFVYVSISRQQSKKFPTLISSSLNVSQIVKRLVLAHVGQIINSHLMI